MLPNDRLHALDAVRAFALLSGVVLHSAAAYLWQFNGWTEWLGLPAPTKLLPNIAGLIGYGIAFGLGWLLNRQVPRLLALQNSWWLYLLAAIALTVVCLNLIGTTPLWKGPNLAGNDRIHYTLAYMMGSWCWVFALVGGSLSLLLLSYHAFVRYTWIGALLTGGRHPRPSQAFSPDTAAKLN